MSLRQSEKILPKQYGIFKTKTDLKFLSEFGNHRQLKRQVIDVLVDWLVFQGFFLFSSWLARNLMFSYAETWEKVVIVTEKCGLHNSAVFVFSFLGVRLTRSAN